MFYSLECWQFCAAAAAALLLLVVVVVRDFRQSRVDCAVSTMNSIVSLEERGTRYSLMLMGV